MAINRWNYVEPVSLEFFEQYANDLTVITPLTIHNISLNSVERQSDLPSARSGSGTDIKLELPVSSNKKWTFEDGVAFCEKLFVELRTKEASDTNFKTQQVMESWVEQQEPHNSVGLVRLQSGLIGLLVQIPEKNVKKLLTLASKSADEFLLLQEIGFNCMRAGTLDIQPGYFREWFMGTLRQDTRIPGPKPKWWNLYPRNVAIINAVNTMKRHGLNHTKNPETRWRDCGFDAVVLAAKKVGVKGISQYDSVNKIYYGK